MSGQWEVVGKKKEKGNSKPVLPTLPQQTYKKKAENLNVKVEDVLAKSQVKNLYSNSNKSKVEVKKAPESGPKKPQKKQEKPVEVPKPKAPKSIESALKLIDVDEFKSVYENSKLHFPDAPIVWLKDLTHFLNQRINVEVQDPVFTHKPSDYPLSAVPSDVKSFIEKATEEVSKSNLQLFFDISLTSMVTDMSKNQSAIGHKLLLQSIALREPNLVTENLAKHGVLRTSYQNRPNIGLSILWAVGQAGTSSFEAGLTIFQELMLPLIELKHYSRYIFKYLLDLINSHQGDEMTKDQFLLLLELIFSNRKNYPHDLRLSLIGTVPNLKSSLFSGNKKDASRNSLEFYLKKIPTVGDDFQRILSDVIIEGFQTDSTSLDQWSKIFSKNIAASAIVLRCLDKNWSTVFKKINQKIFAETLVQINNCGKDLSGKKKKEEGLAEAIRLAEKLHQKMSEKKQSKKFDSVLWGFFFGAIVFTLIDSGVHQGFKNSVTNKVLTQYGAYEYPLFLVAKVKEGILVVDQQIETNYPSQRKTVIEFSAPYVELVGKLGRVLYNIGGNIKEAAADKLPVIVQSIEAYAPGLVEQSQNVASNAWSSTVFYFNRSIDYLKTEVFVGQLSPENMQKVVFQAFNTTQNKATEYYHWLYEKVQSAIK